MPLIGTAGHVDHGKSTLVQRLTGRDPDRWEEEKRRGVTIDLGFAWTDLGDGAEVSFVDVPGHERYLKNMLAGIEAIDVALFVVAANEGWMPQSEEHLAALDLLEVDGGVIALTKSDLVEPDDLELASLDIEERLVGSSLEGSPVIPVSAVSGDGIEELRTALLLKVGETVPRTGRSRMWVDRVFSVPGAGTVATGSLLGGALSKGDQVEIYPSGKVVRIRTIQTHEKPVEAVEPGRRVALGLVGVDANELGRGDMIARRGEWRLTGRFSCALRVARYVSELPDRGAYQAHIGSGAYNVTIERQGDGFAVLRLDTLVPLAMGDRFILRDSGRQVVAAGGQVLDPHPGPARRAIADAANLSAGALPDERANQLIEARGIDAASNIEIDTNGGTPTEAVVISGFAVSRASLGELQLRAESLVGEDHKTNPLNPGLPLATLAEQLGLEPGVAEEVVRSSRLLEHRGPDVATKGHNATLSPEMEESWQAAKNQLGDAGLSVPPVSELGLTDEAIHLLIRDGELVRVAPELVFLASQIKEVVSAVRVLPTPFTVGDLKGALGLSRKYTMPLLEWLDSNQYTIRKGDSRVFGVRLAGDRH